MNNSNISPVGAKEVTKLPFSFLDMRTKILRIFLLGAAAFSLFLIISNWSQATPIIGALILAACLLLLVTAFAPLSYNLKAGILLSIIFILGLNELRQTGIFGNARIIFLAFALLTALLFDRREFFIALGASIVAVAVMGWLLMSGNSGLVSQEVTVGGLATWIVETILMVLVAAAFEEGWTGLRKEYLVSQATLKNAMSTLSNERVNLETRIGERTKEVAANAELERKRADRFQAINELIRIVAFIQEPDEVMKSISRLIGEKFGFYHVGIFLNDDSGSNTILRAANSSGGERMLARGYALKIDQSGIVNYVAASGMPRVAKRIKDDILYDNNPDLPETRSIMALPLTVGNRIIGVLDLENNQEAGVSEQDLEVMSMLASQVSMVIENTRMFSETRNALSEARVVYGHYMRQAWEQIATEKRTIGYRYAASKVDELATPLDLPEIKSAIQSGQSVTSASEQPTITIPLKLRDEVIGVLDIRSNNPKRQWNENEMAIIQAIAERVALALENARLFEETTRRADRERAVSEISTHIRSTTDPQVMLQTALDELKRALGAKDIRIHPYSPPPAEQNGK